MFAPPSSRSDFAFLNKLSRFFSSDFSDSFATRTLLPNCSNAYSSCGSFPADKRNRLGSLASSANGVFADDKKLNICPSANISSIWPISGQYSLTALLLSERLRSLFLFVRSRSCRFHFSTRVSGVSLTTDSSIRTGGKGGTTGKAAGPSCGNFFIIAVSSIFVGSGVICRFLAVLISIT